MITVIILFYWIRDHHWLFYARPLKLFQLNYFILVFDRFGSGSIHHSRFDCSIPGYLFLHGSTYTKWYQLISHNYERIHIHYADFWHCLMDSIFHGKWIKNMYMKTLSENSIYSLILVFGFYKELFHSCMTHRLTTMSFSVNSQLKM